MPDINKTLVSEFTLLKAAVISRYAANDSIVQNVDRSMLMKLAVQLKLTTFDESTARVLFLFPYCKYAERLVSAHNLIKSDTRASISREPLNDFEKESMATLSTFDPRPSITNWLTLR